MIRQLMSGMLAWILVCGTAFAQTPLEASADGPGSVKLVAVILALPAGTPWLSVRVGQGICIYPPTVTSASGEREKQDVTAYAPSFKSELERAGYKAVTPGEENLFDPQASSSDYQAAAVISDVRVDACVSRGGLFADRGSVRGDSSMKIDWQIYSPIKKQIVARVSTSGAGKLDNSVQGGYQRLLMEAFSSNVRELAQNASFREALNAPKAFTKGFVVPGQQSKIVLDGSLKASPRPVADAVGSVVTILTGTGSGSGVLVSNDGYMLTNAHVVGDSKEVRVRWSDRIETLAQVVRSAKDRDIAIIKTNARDRRPLALKRGMVTPGQRVYAVGSPRSEAFQGTVSSGVISADRVIEGLRYIQSDVSISPGSSGGALLDETGSVIGITVSLYLNGGQPAGLNMFIPIGDAMDFLSLEQR
jgi:S1-C subfamily serine protease